MNNISNKISVSCLQYTSQNDEMLTLKIIKPVISSNKITFNSTFIRKNLE